MGYNQKEIIKILENQGRDPNVLNQRWMKEKAFLRLSDRSLELIHAMIDDLYRTNVPNFGGEQGAEDYNAYDTGTSSSVSSESTTANTIEIKAEKMKSIARVDDVCRFIYKKIANLYKLGPARKIEIDGRVDEEKTEWYNGILSENNFDQLIREGELHKEFQGDIEIKVTYLSESDKWVLSMIPSFLCGVVEDPDIPGKAIAKAIKQYRMNDINEKEEYYEVWTDENFWVYNKDWEIEDNPENPDNENKYGVIPLVTFRRGIATTGYYCNCDESVLTSQEIIDKNNLELEWSKHFQSFPIPVLENYEGQFEIKLDPMFPITMPPTPPGANSPNFKFVTPDVRIKELRDDIKVQKVELYHKKGIPPHEIEAISSNMSAKGLEILSDDIVEEREQRIEPALNFEQNLFDTIDRIDYNLTVYRDKETGEEVAKPDRPEYQVNVTFSKQRKTETVEQREKRINLDLELGLTNIYQIYAEENQVDLETAEKKVTENLKTRNRLRNDEFGRNDDRSS